MGQKNTYTFEQAHHIAEKRESIEKIAREILKIKTLDIRNSDQLDFYNNIFVLSIKIALEEAFNAGRARKRTDLGFVAPTYKIIRGNNAN